MCGYLKKNLLPQVGKSLYSKGTQYAFPTSDSSFQIKLDIEPAKVVLPLM